MENNEHPTRVTEQSTVIVEPNEPNHAGKRAVNPAKLPVHSRAAAAQRLSDHPQPPVRGTYYDAPHLQMHPKGWRMRRYIKRKNLRRSNQRYEFMDRIGTRWTLMPMALGSLAIIVVSAGLLVALVAVIQATQQRYQQDVVTLTDILPKDNLKMYDSHNAALYQMVGDGLQTSVQLAQISPQLVHAEIAVEDQYFWSNQGYDITGIVRAALDNYSHGHVVSGGSTITQQLIKNAVVGNQDTAMRKMQELILAPSVTRRFTKQQILTMYLNTTYYGEQSYGADAAAFTYFDLKDTPQASAASQLDIAQGAMLAGIPSSPIARDPLLHPQAALTRMREVLDQMQTQKYITRQEEDTAFAEAQKPGFFHRGIIHNNNLYSHFVNYSLRELSNTLHVRMDELPRSGLRVSTTINPGLQDQILKIAQQHIAEMKYHNMTNAAEVLIDYHNGNILTLLGNINPNDPNYGAFDVASQGYRQPGSSFKPFIYATAFEKGLITPSDMVLDAPISVSTGYGLPVWSPKNYDRSYHGLMTYRHALQNSFNIPAVKVLLKTGVDPALHTAQAMGIKTYEGDPNYTMVLGTLSVHLLDETAAYGAFANHGVRIPAHAVNTVTDTQGHVIYHFVPQGQRVISRQAADTTTNVLSDNSARTYEFGKCSALYLYSGSQQGCYAGTSPIRPAAAKTGTSELFADNWTVGYTTDYVMGVWSGNNDNSPMKNVIGVDGAGPIWHDSLVLAEQGRPIRGFTPPA